MRMLPEPCQYLNVVLNIVRQQLTEYETNDAAGEIDQPPNEVDKQIDDPRKEFKHEGYGFLNEIPGCSEERPDELHERGNNVRK